MRRCIVTGCPTTGRDSLRMFALPDPKDDAPRLRRWLDVTGNPEISLAEASKLNRSQYTVCELHFAEDDIKNIVRWRLMGGRKILKDDAVPTLLLKPAPKDPPPLPQQGGEISVVGMKTVMASASCTDESAEYDVCFEIATSPFASAPELTVGDTSTSELIVSDVPEITLDDDCEVVTENFTDVSSGLHNYNKSKTVKTTSTGTCTVGTQITSSFLNRPGVRSRGTQTNFSTNEAGCQYQPLTAGTSSDSRLRSASSPSDDKLNSENSKWLPRLRRRRPHEPAETDGATDDFPAFVKTEPESDDDDYVPAHQMVSCVLGEEAPAEQQSTGCQCDPPPMYIKTEPKSDDEGDAGSLPEDVIESGHLGAQQNHISHSETHTVFIKAEPVSDEDEDRIPSCRTGDASQGGEHPVFVKTEPASDEDGGTGKVEAVATEQAADIRMFCKVEYEPEAGPRDEPSAPGGQVEYEYVRYTKESSCCYCRKQYSRMTEHLLSHHRNEKDVRFVLGEPLEVNRTAMLFLLQSRGNHMHNLEVLQRGKGTLIVAFDGKRGAAVDHVPCPTCLGYFSEATANPMCRHRCQAKSLAKRQEKRAVLNSQFVNASQNATLEDQVLQLARMSPAARNIMESDATLLEWGLRTAGEIEHLGSYKRNSLLESRLEPMGQLLSILRARARDDNLTLAEAIDPDNMQQIASACREVISDNIKSRIQVALGVRQLLHWLNECADLCKAGCLRRGFREQAGGYDDFIRSNIAECYGINIPTDEASGAVMPDESDISVERSRSGIKRSVSSGQTGPAHKRKVADEAQPVKKKPAKDLANQVGTSPGAHFKYGNPLWEANCCFCKAPLPAANLVLHLVSEHEDEPEVRAVLEEGSQLNRQDMWALLQNRGNHLHNVKALQDGQGTLLVSLSPGHSPSDSYASCPDCAEYYTVPRKTHVCPVVELSSRQAKQEKVQFMLYGARSAWEKRLAAMRVGRGRFVISNELLRADRTIHEWALIKITSYCTLRCRKKDFIKRDLYHTIAPVVHFLAHARKRAQSEDLTLAQVFDPDNVGAFLEAVDTLPVVRNAKKGYVSRVRRMLFALTECAAVCRLDCMKRAATEEAERYGEFMRRCVPEVLSSELESKCSMNGAIEAVLDDESDDNDYGEDEDQDEDDPEDSDYEVDQDENEEEEEDEQTEESESESEH